MTLCDLVTVFAVTKGANQEGFNNPLVGNGFCNNETNNAACNYDGGDCCGSNVNLQYFSDCECILGD